MMTFSKFQPLLDLMGVIPAKYNDLISETYSLGYVSGNLST